MEWVWSKFCFFGELKMLEFHGFHGFWVDSLLWSHELKEFCRISCLSVTEKTQNSQKIWKIHVFNAVSNFIMHHRHTGCIQTSVSLGFNGILSERCTFGILEFLKKKARGFPSYAQGKEIDSGIVA